MKYTPDDLLSALGNVRLRYDLARAVVDSRITSEFDDRLRSGRAVDLGDGTLRVEALSDEAQELASFSGIVTYAFLGEIDRGAFEVFLGDEQIPAPPNLRALLGRLAAVGLIEGPRSFGVPTFGISLKLPIEFAPDTTESLADLLSGSVFFERLDAWLPLVTTWGRTELHQLQHPLHATAACFATMAGRLGVIAAGHSLDGAQPGSAVPLAWNREGRFVRSGYQPIDAAFVSIHSAPLELEPLVVRAYPTVGDAVNIETKRGPVDRHVVQVNNTMVGPHFSEYPVMFYMDGGCTTGDSGALISLEPGGEAIGIYTGTHRAADPNAAEPLGIGQNFAQAVYTLGVEPMREIGALEDW